MIITVQFIRYTFKKKQQYMLLLSSADCWWLSFKNETSYAERKLSSNNLKLSCSKVFKRVVLLLENLLISDSDVFYEEQQL